MDWLWISAIVLFVAGLIVFLPLLSRSHKTEPRKPVENRNATNLPSTTEGSSARVDNRDRDEMLDGVRNLARDNPKKVASMVRHWMKE